MKKILLLFAIISLVCNYESVSQNLKAEEDFKKYFRDNISSLDPIEGIWSISQVWETYHFNSLINSRNAREDERMAIMSSGNYYIAYYYSVKGLHGDNEEIRFTKTNSNKLYIVEHFYDKVKKTDPNVSAYAMLTDNSLLQWSSDKYPTYDKFLFYKEGKTNIDDYKFIETHKGVKIFPNNSTQGNSSKSGTGFAISSNGIIVTNYHVIEGATSIKIRGINSDFSKSYKAKILTTDVNNDLALLQISDNNFLPLGSTPYVIKSGTSKVGENIFVLGYPLLATMGSEIKLTNGIISSKTGFQGDVTTYQISAAVQPGNSGGPLFDINGNLIGIISAKHLGAENVSYAIKANYLINLIELIPDQPKLQTTNTLLGKSLAYQTEIVKKFVYIIEVN